MNNEKCNQNGKNHLPNIDACETIGGEEIIEIKRFTPQQAEVHPCNPRQAGAIYNRNEIMSL